MESRPNNPYLREVDRLLAANADMMELNGQTQRYIRELNQQVAELTIGIEQNSSLVEQSKVQALQFVLRENGLAVCDKFGFHQGDLDIFPKTDLRFLYNQQYHAQGYNAWYEWYIATLCPEHFPDVFDQVLESPILPSMQNITSEVKEIKGRFLRTLDEEDVINIPQRQGYYEAMFEKYGLPKPDKLRHSSGFTFYWYGSIQDICKSVPRLRNENVPVPSWIKYG